MVQSSVVLLEEEEDTGSLTEAIQEFNREDQGEPESLQARANGFSMIPYEWHVLEDSQDGSQAKQLARGRRELTQYRLVDQLEQGVIIVANLSQSLVVMPR